MASEIQPAFQSQLRFCVLWNGFLLWENLLQMYHCCNPASFRWSRWRSIWHWWKPENHSL